MDSMDSIVDESELHDPDFPSLPKRLLLVFVSPGKLNGFLADNPKWFMALLASTALIGLSVAFMPVEIFFDAQRQVALERGTEFPEMSERALGIMQYVIPIGAVISSFVITIIFAGLYTLVFAFILGDEGRFKQYLAVLAHSSFIAAAFALLATPLRISMEDPQFTLNVASFLVFLPDGYLLNVFRALDLTQIWSTMVVAQGVHTIDKRRSFGSAATILMAILLAFALVVANFM